MSYVIVLLGAFFLAGARWPAAEHVAGWFDPGGYDATGVPGRSMYFGRSQP